MPHPHALATRQTLALAVAALTAAVLTVAPARTRAQSPPPTPGPVAWQLVRPALDGAVSVHTAWTAVNPEGHRTARVTVTRLGADLRSALPPSVPVVVHAGPPVLTTVAVDGATALVAMFNGGAEAFVKLAVVDLAAPPGTAPRVLTVPRGVGADADFAPTSAVACADPGGFTVVWQELSRHDPAHVQAHAFLARVGPDGAWVQPPAAVDLPWALAALAWNGHGYHLAVYYSGAGPDQTRLNLVTLDPAGRPEQHPWWISPLEAIGEVQLLPTTTGVLAVYRGGPDGRTVHSTFSHAVGEWGREPPAPMSHGLATATDVLVVRVEPDGRVHVVRQPMTDPPAAPR